MKHLTKNILDIMITMLAAMVIIGSVFSFLSILKLSGTAGMVNHTNVVKNNIVQVISTLKDIEIGQRGYLITYDTTFMEPQPVVEKKIAGFYKELDSLFIDNEEQRLNLLTLKRLVSERLYISSVTLKLGLERKPPEQINQSLKNGKNKMNEVKSLTDLMLNNEDNLLVNRTDINKRQARITPLIALFISIASLIVLFILLAKTRQENQDRKQTNEELKQINTALQQQQDFVDAVFDASVDVMSVMNRNLVFTKFNKAGLRIYNTTKEELIGKSFVDIFPHVKRTSLYQQIQKAFDGEILHQTEYYSPPAKKYFELFLVPLKDRNEKVESVLLIGHDITANVASKQLLQQQNHQLELTNQELASFSYIASHDLKEPLRKIQMFSKRIQEIATFSDKAEDYFNRIIGASERMQNLIGSLLNFSQANNTELNYENCDLNEIFRQATTYIQETIRDTKPIIKSDVLPVIKGLPVQLTQLFSNLLDNAIKYARQGVQPTITITTHETTGKEINSGFANKQNEYYRIDFTDNGIGFDQQYEHKIFEIFQRLHTRSEYSGTGIGLAICKKIVSNHHGFISAKGEPDRGATFSLYFPKEV